MNKGVIIGIGSLVFYLFSSYKKKMEEELAKLKKTQENDRSYYDNKLSEIDEKANLFYKTLQPTVWSLRVRNTDKKKAENCYECCYELQLYIKNTSNTEWKITGVNVQLFLYNEVACTIKNNSYFTLPAGSTTKIVVGASKKQVKLIKHNLFVKLLKEWTSFAGKRAWTSTYSLRRIFGEATTEGTATVILQPASVLGIGDKAITFKEIKGNVTYMGSEGGYTNIGDYSRA